MAAAQSTMNNTTWGNAKYQYYETICGGTGAGVLNDGTGHHGTPAVHTHMTNLAPDRPGSAGMALPGSAGAVRDPPRHRRQRQVPRRRWRPAPHPVPEGMTVAILSGHRVVPPPGLAGGQPGALGRTRILRADGTVEELRSADKREVGPGDTWLLETPGGGGCGVA